MFVCKKYMETHSLQSRDARGVIDEFADKLATMHGKCIDIGCGPGDVTKNILLPKLPSDAVVIGTDICDDMLSASRRLANGNGRLNFTKLDINMVQLPIHEIGNYNNAVSFHVLHFSQNMRHTMKNIYSLLRPFGQGLFMFLAYHPVFEIYQKLHRDPRYQNYTQDAVKYMPQWQRSVANADVKLKKALQEAGFQVLHCSKRENTYIYENLKCLQDHMLGVNPFLERLPDNLKDDFTIDLTRDMAMNKIDPENSEKILDKYTVLVAHVIKAKGLDEFSNILQ